MMKSQCIEFDTQLAIRLGLIFEDIIVGVTHKHGEVEAWY